MGIFSRFGDIIAANMNDMIERAEDPAKMIRMIVMEMEETLVEVRSSAARTIADQKEMQRTLVRLVDAQAGWTEKAELALSKDREDLAKAALVERAKLADVETQMRHDIDLLDEALAKHADDIQKLEAKLREARARQQSILARLETAENRARMRRIVSSGRLDDAFSRFDMLERRVDLAEGRAESFDMGRTRTLAEEINALKVNDSIEAELAAMKSRVSKSGEQG